MEINLTNCLILTHAFVKENEVHKLEPLNFALKHWRYNNPDSYIILAGHGLRPNVENCDYVHWEETINDKDINVGHPRLCNIAYDHATEKGFTKILKSRSDSIHLIKNIADYSDTLLKDKQMLITQQTTIDRPQMGDLFLYGNLNFIKQCWNINTWYPTNTGVTSLANNFMSVCEEENWHDACINNLSFVNIYNIKWICLQKNWTVVQNNQQQVLDNNLPDWHNHLWGSKQKWHTWDKDGKFVYSKPKVGRITTEKDWQ